MASSVIELPTFKGRPGWEFTDISELDLRRLRAARCRWSARAAFGRALGAWKRAELPCAACRVNVERRRARPINVGPRCHRRSSRSRSRPFRRRAARSSTSGRGSCSRRAPRREVWEQSLSASEELDGVFNITTELVVGDAARLRYVWGQALSERTWVFGSQRATVARDARLDWVALGFGSRSGHVRMETRLAARAPTLASPGPTPRHGRQHIDFDTTQEHAAPNTTSDLAFRGVLQGRSSAVWKGNIIVDPGAQKTDAFQESRNLLISKRAHADAIPGLEIQANDVRCTHAAAVAQVDPEQLFYLRSHGLEDEVAKRLVIEGFLAALVERFEQGPCARSWPTRSSAGWRLSSPAESGRAARRRSRRSVRCNGRGAKPCSARCRARTARRCACPCYRPRSCRRRPSPPPPAARPPGPSGARVW